MKIKLLCVLGLLPLLAGCAGYQSRPLNKLPLAPVPSNKQISFAARAFDATDCQEYLGRDVIQAGYTPIQIGIKNESERDWRFSLDEINMSTVPADFVAPLVYQSVAARAVDYGLPSAACIIPSCFFLSALASSSWVAVIVGIALLPYSIPALASGLALGAAAITDSHWASQANEQLLHDYLNKSLHDRVLLPNTGLGGLVFVNNRNLKDELVVTLTATDGDTQDKVVCRAAL